MQLILIISIDRAPYTRSLAMQQNTISLPSKGDQCIGFVRCKHTYELDNCIACAYIDTRYAVCATIVSHNGRM